MKKMLKVKAETTMMVFSDLGSVEDWVMVGHGDAGIKSMPDKVTLVGGHVVMIWKSKQIRRKVISSLAGEAMAMINTIGEIVYTVAVLEQIYGSRIRAMPKVVVTDAHNLEEAILSHLPCNIPCKITSLDIWWSTWYHNWLCTWYLVTYLVVYLVA